MNHLDLQVIRQARQWVDEGKPVWLCTVLATYGSAPRAPGSMLVALDTGEHRGSLSGGCVEDDFLERLAAGQFSAASQIVRYGEGGLAPNVSLPCGGVLDVLVEHLEADCDARDHLGQLAQALEGQQILRRVVSLGGSSRSLEPATSELARVSVTAEEVVLRMGAARRLVIAGLSPVAEFCASYALSLGFEVVVCDPRVEVLEGFAMAGVQVHEVLPALFIANGGCHAATAVVALTHDPRLDDPTLVEAVRTEAFYIGAMGSRRTSDKRLERLERIGGLSGADLQRLHAPIGLNLGSKTPAEIALAVMADIVRIGNGLSRAAL